MKNMTIPAIAAACGGILYGTDETAAEVSGVVIDSRLVQPGNLFIAAKGERTDGHSYIPQAIISGAAAVVCEYPPAGRISVPHIVVTDSFQALKDIAAFYRLQLTLPIIGITGSVGKTSTKEFIAAVLKEKYRVLKTEGNFNNEVGLPLTVLRIRAEHQVAVLEMGISDFGEMHRLSAIARPDICVLTNIGQCHLENLGTKAGVLRAKTEIFDFLSPEGFVCINGDDEMLAALVQVKGKPPLRFGLAPTNQIYAGQIVNRGLLGTRALIHVATGTKARTSGGAAAAFGAATADPAAAAFGAAAAFEVAIPLPGEHMIYNALAAVCVGHLLGVSWKSVRNGLQNLTAVKGRNNIIALPSGILIDDCYNANPVSMKAALDLLQMAPSRKVAVLGDMLELGKEEIALHEKIGRIAAARTDVLVCIGRLARHIYRAAMKFESPDAGLQEYASREYELQECEAQEYASQEYRAQEYASQEYELQTGDLNAIFYFPDKPSFMEQAGNIIRPGDTILFKASHGMGFETLVEDIKTGVMNG